MFNVDEFEARYKAATTPDEQWAVLVDGVKSYGQHVAVATAEFMDFIDSQEFDKATVHAMEISESLRSMAMGLQVIHMLSLLRDGKNT